MARRALGIGAIALLAGFAPPAARAEGAPATLTVVWFDLAGLPPPVGQAAAEELRSALAPAGVDLEVRAGDVDETLKGDELVLVLLPRDTPPRAHHASVLGAVLREGPDRRTAWVHLPAILDTLGLPRTAGPRSAVEQRHMARALGRVAAHEVVHLILPGRAHARSGLMAASLGRSALTAPSARLDAGTRRAVGASLGSGRPWATRQASNDVDSRAGGGTHWP
jgi:hypothetical protein